MTITPPTPPKAKPYITIIPGRTPKQKAHLNLGQAKNAVRQPVKVVYEKRPGDGWVRAYSAGPNQGAYLRETIDGIETGRRKYSSPNCGGQIWQLVGEEWKLVYDIPAGTLDHEIPWETGWEFYSLDVPAPRK